MRICVRPDSGSSAGIGSGHTEIMCDMRRSVNDRDERADKMLGKLKEQRKYSPKGGQEMPDLLAKVKLVLDDGIDVFPAHDDLGS